MGKKDDSGSESVNMYDEARTSYEYNRTKYLGQVGKLKVCVSFTHGIYYGFSPKKSDSYYILVSRGSIVVGEQCERHEESGEHPIEILYNTIQRKYNERQEKARKEAEIKKENEVLRAVEEARGLLRS